MSYKKVKTVFIFDKPKCIYMKPKGTREYVKSKGEMVLLSAYIKKAEKIAAKKALASKMAKKSKASKRPMKKMGLKKGSIYGGFFNEVGEVDEVDVVGKVSEEQMDKQQPMSGGQGFEKLVSKENVEKLLSFLKTTGGKKVKRVSKGKKVKRVSKAKKPNGLKHVSSVALMKRRGIKRRGGEGGNRGEEDTGDY
jgi:hypothetical protein